MDAQVDKREWLKSKADILTESEAAEVLEYITIMQSLGQQTAGPELFYRALIYFGAGGKHKGRALRH